MNSADVIMYPMPIPDSNQSIPDFYSGRSIFITGATGFVGKVIVEKLLRSCPDVSNIYVLIRSTDKQIVHERLAEIFKSPCFANLLNEQPDVVSKVVPIAGDMVANELGISESDQDLLCQKVSVVFHSAASVKFNDELCTSIKNNLVGTQRLMQLCHRMPSLKAFVYVSTAFANSDRHEIDEIVYPTTIAPKYMIELVTNPPNGLIEKLLPTLLGAKPNIYTLAKSLTEQLLNDVSYRLPIAIVRPSAITASFNEPMPGWMENWYGPTGICYMAGIGALRTRIHGENLLADIIPVDLVSNMLIAAAWQTAQDGIYGVKVYNCVSGARNPITWGQLFEQSLKSLVKNPLEDVVRYPQLALRSNRLINAVYAFWAQTIPALAMDLLSRIMGKRPRVQQSLNKFSRANQFLEFFTINQWRFKDDNAAGLMDRMNVNDRQIFPFDVRTIRWEPYIEQYMLGMREHLCKQRPDTLATSRAKMEKLYYRRQLTRAFVVASAGLVFWSHRNILMEYSKSNINRLKHLFGMK